MDQSGVDKLGSIPAVGSYLKSFAYDTRLIGLCVFIIVLLILIFVIRPDWRKKVPMATEGMDNAGVPKAGGYTAVSGPLTGYATEMSQPGQGGVAIVSAMSSNDRGRQTLVNGRGEPDFWNFSTAERDLSDDDMAAALAAKQASLDRRYGEGRSDQTGGSTAPPKEGLVTSQLAAGFGGPKKQGFMPRPSLSPEDTLLLQNSGITN